MFGLLWGRSLRVWVPACHIAPFPTVVKLASRGGIGRVHRYPLEELQCVSPKRRKEMAALLILRECQDFREFFVQAR
jgi:hypothetical protein